MMNIIQQITDPMPTKLSYIASAKLLLLSLLLHLLQNHSYHCYTCYKITAITVTVTIAAVTTIKLSNYFATDHIAVDN